MKLSRRKFIVLAGVMGVSALLVGVYESVTSRRRIPPLEGLPEKSTVYIIATNDRRKGVQGLLDSLDLDLRDEPVAIKANFNSDDPYPGSTHIETLRAIIEGMQQASAKDIQLAERSGMGNTRRVLESCGVFELAHEMGFTASVLEELDKDGWVNISPEGTHWLKGFSLPKLFLETKHVIQTCCLKTHRFGGHITLSLKNSVGLVAKRLPGGIYDYMTELHTSPFQRLMIPEINRFYKVDAVIMDALKSFVKGGPEKGTVVEPGVMLASRDRVAIDAVGVAILRSYGSTDEVMRGKIFELEQIKRAAELGVGVNSADRIELNPLDEQSQPISEKIAAILSEG